VSPVEALKRHDGQATDPAVIVVEDEHGLSLCPPLRPLTGGVGPMPPG
jgi:hypothetical protein